MALPRAPLRTPGPVLGAPGSGLLWQTWSAAPCFRSSSNWGSSSWGFRAPGYMPHGKDGPTLTATPAPKGAVHWPGRGGAGLGGVKGRCCLSDTLGQGRAQGRPGSASIPDAFSS